jgi:hypothetical protein
MSVVKSADGIFGVQIFCSWSSVEVNFSAVPFCWCLSANQYCHFIACLFTENWPTIFRLQKKY